MKKSKILVALRVLYTKRIIDGISSIVIAIIMFLGIKSFLPKDINNSKSHIKTFIDDNGNYRESQEYVINVGDNIYRGIIKIDAFAEKSEDEESKENIVANNVQGGFDSYTPTQTVTSNGRSASQSSSNNTSTINNTSSSNNNQNNSNINSNSNSNSNSNDNSADTNSNNTDSNISNDEEATFIDRSSFVGKDVIISEGQPFNPMNILQLSATDIDGKNITNKIVVLENNVDPYKPGLYTVKANVELSNNTKLEKEFSVRVEPTVLELAVTGIKTSKEVLEKNESFTMSFNVNSSKSYLDVASININGSEYSVNKISERNLFKSYDKYEVELEASNKAGTHQINIENVTMTDGTLVDINKTTNIEVLKEDAIVNDVKIDDVSDETSYKIKVNFKIEDVDNTIYKPYVVIYNEKNNIVINQQVEKNTYVDSMFNVEKDGVYTVKIMAQKLFDEYGIEYSNEIELFSTEVKVSSKEEETDSEETLSVRSVSRYSYNLDEENIEVYSIDSISTRATTADVTGVDSKEYTHEIKITGDIANDKGEIKPGTLQVTVPTTANFKVDKNGNFTAPNITISNDGTQSVDIFAYKFIDTNGTTGINVQGKDLVTNNQNNVERNNIALNLEGNMSTAYFSSNKGSGTGVYSDENLNNASVDGIKIATISAGSSYALRLNGEAGKKASGIDKPIQDSFTLILKVKKSTTN